MPESSFLPIWHPEESPARKRLFSMVIFGSQEKSVNRMVVRIFAVSLIIVACSFVLGWFHVIRYKYLYGVPALLAVYLGVELLASLSRRKRQHGSSR